MTRLKRIAAGTTCAAALCAWPLVTAPAQAEIGLSAPQVGTLLSEPAAGAPATTAGAVPAAPAELTLEQTSGEPGSVVTGRGSGFDRLSVDAALERLAGGEAGRVADAPAVSLHWGSADGPILWKGTAQLDGGIEFRFEVPSSAEEGDATVVAMQEGAGEKARAAFRVLAPAAESPAAGAPIKLASPDGTSGAQAADRRLDGAREGSRRDAEGRRADRRREARRDERGSKRPTTRGRASDEQAQPQAWRDWYMPPPSYEDAGTGYATSDPPRQSVPELEKTATKPPRAATSDGGGVLWILISVAILGGLLAATSGFRVWTRRTAAAAGDSETVPADAAESDPGERHEPAPELVGKD